MDAALIVGIFIGVLMGFALGYVVRAEMSYRRWHKYFKDA